MLAVNATASSVPFGSCILAALTQSLCLICAQLRKRSQGRPSLALRLEMIAHAYFAYFVSVSSPGLHAVSLLSPVFRLFARWMILVASSMRRSCCAPCLVPQVCGLLAASVALASLLTLVVCSFFACADRAAGAAERAAERAAADPRHVDHAIQKEPVRKPIATSLPC